ncbi:MAG: histidine kinase [Pyrinomonadaceae bacterium]
MTRSDPRKIIPSFWTIQLVGWIVYFVVIYVTFLTIAPPAIFTTLLFLKGFRSLTGFVLTSFLLRPIYKRFGERLSIKGIVLLVLACSVVLGTGWTAIEGVFVYLTNTAFDTPGYLARGPRIGLDYAMTLTAWSALYLGAKHWISWQNESEKALQSSAMAQTAQLEMLRYQLNPHFLFNALNSIRASVDEDSTRAKQMITQLSEFLRYSLVGGSNKTVPLRDELEAVQNYLAIEKIRFEDKLIVEFDIEPAAESFQVPNFLLNPLVENAVKHGLRTSKKPLEMRIVAGVINNVLFVDVTNSGMLTAENNDDSGIGLRNVRERLHTLFGEGARFELSEDDGFVTARIEIANETQSDNR